MGESGKLGEASDATIGSDRLADSLDSAGVNLEQVLKALDTGRPVDRKVVEAALASVSAARRLTRKGIQP